jgi:MFS family permease
MSVTTTTTEAFELQPLPAFSTRRPSYTRTAAKNHSVVLPKDDGPSRSVEDEAFTPLASEPQPLSKLRMTLIIVQPSLINFLQSFASAIITVGLPSIARSIELPRSLYLWPSSVYGLTSGALLLIAGAIADIVGARIVELVGIFILGIFTLACGFSATGIQLVVFRALQGFGTALHLPASVALVAAAVPSGKARNIGFACLGLSQPLGFSTGLVVSGIMIERTGWRSAFYLCGGAILVAAVAAIWTLPKVKVEEQRDGSLTLLKKVYKEIDWVGGTIASAGFAILSYVLAYVVSQLHHHGY